MRFRPLIGYLLILGVIIVYGVFSVRFFYRETSLLLFVIGGMVGILIGLFLGLRAFQAVDPLLIIESHMNGKESYNLFGPLPYRLVITIWIVYLNVSVFMSPFSNVGIPMVDGVFYGGIFSYFICFAVKAFSKERVLNGRIIITVDS